LRNVLALCLGAAFVFAVTAYAGEKKDPSSIKMA
jgi:hypothetical protein